MLYCIAIVSCTSESVAEAPNSSVVDFPLCTTVKLNESDVDCAGDIAVGIV